MFRTQTTARALAATATTGLAGLALAGVAAGSAAASSASSVPVSTFELCAGGYTADAYQNGSVVLSVPGGQCATVGWHRTSAPTQMITITVVVHGGGTAGNVSFDANHAGLGVRAGGTSAHPALTEF
ncbi:hypothetical protein [Actinacidiphila rubida]|uniref:Uncharacterized protein n=1 Tax=Actinacidiphila rubida TaxID=310780 RepID=A0A1H8JEN9_9ACTN|nr:hypothetical protein [Actinacidiphila rubida]SEN78658.1 hypothetical protein SAMN05216267_101051 [Actinacidiphila rubida]